MIQVQDISKKFGSNEVLTSISLQLAAGKVYGIVGENGAGKTTLFRCIAGLEDYEGTIKSDKSPLKDHLGLLLTDPFFFPKITGREYLLLLANARKVAIENIDARNIFDLPLDQYASTYSTGMKKKLALLAILLQKNEYFILDEPFNGVDIQSNLLITEIILDLKAKQKTVLISSHIFSTLRDTCDEIHVMQSGRIVKTVLQANFDQLEAEMKAFYVGEKLKSLAID